MERLPTYSSLGGYICGDGEVHAQGKQWCLGKWSNPSQRAMSYVCNEVMMQTIQSDLVDCMLCCSCRGNIGDV